MWFSCGRWRCIRCARLVAQFRITFWRHTLCRLIEYEMWLGRKKRTRHYGVVSLQSLPIVVAITPAFKINRNKKKRIEIITHNIIVVHRSHTWSKHWKMVIGLPDVCALVFAAADYEPIVGAERSLDMNGWVGESLVLADERQVSQIEQANARIVWRYQYLFMYAMMKRKCKYIYRSAWYIRPLVL